MKKANYLFFPSANQTNEIDMQTTQKDLLKKLEKTEFSEITINMSISINIIEKTVIYGNFQRKNYQIHSARCQKSFEIQLMLFKKKTF